MEKNEVVRRRSVSVTLDSFAAEVSASTLIFEELNAKAKTFHRPGTKLYIDLSELGLF